MTSIRIGVLGGIGPEATAEFYYLLIKKLQESGKIRSNTDFPQIIVNSIPAPELIHDEISEEDLKPYAKGLKELDKLGCDFIVMVCNTTHLYYDTLQPTINTEILDLRKAVKEEIGRRGIKSVAILGTKKTVREGLYRCDGVKCSEPNEEELQQLTEAIFNFNNGYEKERQKKRVEDIGSKYIREGAETVILGCTEFAAMLGKENMPTINTIEVLAEAVLRRLRSF